MSKNIPTTWKIDSTKKETIQINKNAGFFIRFFSLSIDLLIFSIIGISSSLMCIGKHEIKENSGIFIYKITTNYLYYIWLLLLIFLLIIQFILIPFIMKGKTIGMLIARLQMVSLDNESIYKKIIKRNQITSLMWVLSIILFIAFVSPNIANKLTYYSYVQKNPNNPIYGEELVYKLSGWETAFITVPSTITSILIFIHLFFLVSIGIDKNKKGLLEKFTNTKIEYINKFQTIEIEKELIDIKPEKYIKPKIEWKE